MNIRTKFVAILVAGSVLSGFASQAAAAQNNNFDSCKIVQVNDNHAYAPFRHSYDSVNFEGTDGSGKYDISPEILEYLGFIKTGGR